MQFVNGSQIICNFMSDLYKESYLKKVNSILIHSLSFSQSSCRYIWVFLAGGDNSFILFKLK